MVIILTNSQDATVSYLVSALEKSKVHFLRLDTDKLISKVAISYTSGKPVIKTDNFKYRPEDISVIWYRRPEKLKDNRFDNSSESRYTLAEWAEFIECFFAHVPKTKWINHPSCNSQASRKLEQLTRASSLGLMIPDTLATQEPDDLRAFYKRHDGRLIVKPISIGYIERPGESNDTLIYTNRVESRHLENLTDLTICPTLFQQFIQKQCDVRITVLDTDIHAVAIKASDIPGEQRCDIRRNNMADVAYESITLPESIKTKLMRLMSYYGLRFAAIDMAVSTAGEWYFFEINPNGQWAWLDMSANMNISASFIKSFTGPAIKST